MWIYVHAVYSGYTLGQQSVDAIIRCPPTIYRFVVQLLHVYRQVSPRSTRGVLQTVATTYREIQCTLHECNKMSHVTCQHTLKQSNLFVYYDLYMTGSISSPFLLTSSLASSLPFANAVFLALLSSDSAPSDLRSGFAVTSCSLI